MPMGDKKFNKSNKWKSIAFSVAVLLFLPFCSRGAMLLPNRMKMKPPPSNYRTSADSRSQSTAHSSFSELKIAVEGGYETLLQEFNNTVWRGLLSNQCAIRTFRQS
jgi:hypothetical protein